MRTWGPQGPLRLRNVKSAGLARLVEYSQLAVQTRGESSVAILIWMKGVAHPVGETISAIAPESRVVDEGKIEAPGQLADDLHVLIDKLRSVQGLTIQYGTRGLQDRYGPNFGHPLGELPEVALEFIDRNIIGVYLNLQERNWL